MRFWDASALVPLCVREKDTELLRGIFMTDRNVFVWWATPVECAAALARQHREGGLPEAKYERALSVLVGESAGWRAVAPTPLLREEAMRAVRVHALKTGDALQLAAARVWAQQRPTGNSLVSLDLKLRRAASLEGFTVLPE